tara:strand:- start:368 stop:634 length:267 start_codon:yes stop_codon:yes gene_type:complete
VHPKKFGRKKAKKVKRTTTPLFKEEKKKKGKREIRRVLSLSLSLSLSFSASVTRARARLLWSLSLLRFCLFALLSSERREERIKRALF